VGLFERSPSGIRIARQTGVFEICHLLLDVTASVLRSCKLALATLPMPVE
jgi:hypothetical protein